MCPIESCHFQRRFKVIHFFNGRTLPNFCACCLWPLLSPLPLCTSGLMDDDWRHVFISCTVGQWVRIQHNVMFRSSPGGGTSWTSIRQLQCSIEFIRMRHGGRSLL